MTLRKRQTDYASVVASIGRSFPKEDAEAHVSVEVLRYLEACSDEADCDPGPVAFMVILDLAAALISFGGAKSVEELVAWLRAELPARARELDKAVSNSRSSGSLREVQPCGCLKTPRGESWH